MHKIIDIVQRLQTLDLPLTYRAFESVQAPPFLCYLVPSSRTAGADLNTSMLKINSFTVELYTKTRNFALEDCIFNLFSDADVAVNSDFIASENLNVTYFEFEFFEK